jgi:hypothetical protein
MRKFNYEIYLVFSHQKEGPVRHLYCLKNSDFEIKNILQEEYDRHVEEREEKRRKRLITYSL